MRLYETLYLVKPDLSEEEYGLLREKFQKVITRSKGTLVKEEIWGKRELAYPVQKYMQGYYVLLHYAGMPGISFELERELRLDERVMKYNTIKLTDKYSPETPEEPKEETTPETQPDEGPEQKEE